MLEEIIRLTFSIPMLILFVIGIFTHTHYKIILLNREKRLQEEEDEREWDSIQRQLRFKLGLNATNTYDKKDKKKNDKNT